MEKQLVEYVVRALVDEPDSVSITQVDGEQSAIIELRVAPDDMGKVIGRQGRVANAIRTIMHTVALRNDTKRVMLDIID